MKFSEWLRGPVPREKFRDPIPQGDWVIIGLNCFVICVWAGYELAGLLYRALPRLFHFFLP